MPAEAVIGKPPVAKWTTTGRWSPDGLQLLDRFNQVVIDYGPKPDPKPATTAPSKLWAS